LQPPASWTEPAGNQRVSDEENEEENEGPSFWTRVKDGAESVTLAFFIVLVMIVAVVIGPLIAIGSLNLLSEEAHWGWTIPHSPWTYLALYGLALAFGAGGNWKSWVNSGSGSGSGSGSSSSAS
jgi:hypothetical protein